VLKSPIKRSVQSVDLNKDLEEQGGGKQQNKTPAKLGLMRRRLMSPEVIPIPMPIEENFDSEYSNFENAPLIAHR
jgi:hypothetical protein